MVLFALSCVGLLLFLWLSFGGTIPFNPQGYEFQSLVPERGPARDPGRRADRRRVGRQGDRQVARPAGQPDDRDDPDGQPVRADPCAERPRDPADEDDPRRDLRRADARVRRAPSRSPTAGCCRAARSPARSSSSDIFNALDPKTRRAFQVWQQELAKAVKGNDQNLNDVLGNLPHVRRRRDRHPARARRRARVGRPAGPERRHGVRRAGAEPVGAAQPDHHAARPRSHDHGRQQQRAGRRRSTSSRPS